jgi:Rieske Fe-S protein
LPFSKYPQLQQSGGSVTLNANNYSDPTCGQSNIIVFENGGSYTALSTSCTHACCTVSFTGSGFSCPCHGAKFDLTGKCTNGRAGRPLASLTVCADSTGVYVTT